MKKIVLVTSASENGGKVMVWIKYRAWYKEKKTMVAMVRVACEPISQVSVIKVGVPWDSKKFGEKVEVYNDELVIMQCTRLKDKDGDSRSRQLARKLNKVQSEIDWLKTKEKEIIHTIKGYEKKEVGK